MNYQQLIMEIQTLKTFTARDVASLLKMPLKEATNDLIRLRKMGFLTRRKAPRECFSKSGLICNRGTENVYQLNEQAKQYAKWIKNVKPAEDSVRMSLASEIVDCMSPELRKRVFNYFQARKNFRYKGPSRRSALLDDSTVCLAILARALKS
jgi:hypothetical protein